MKFNWIINLKVQIREIYPPYIYSVLYDEEVDDEFHRLFDLWNDVNYVVTFMRENEELLKDEVWNAVSIPEVAAQQVLDEAEALEDLFEFLLRQVQEGKKPDFDSHFKYLDGKYRCEITRIPMKSYGTEKPSFLRLYAIKLGDNQYLITGGGVKLAKTIQESPDLKDHVIQHIDLVRNYLQDNGIIDVDDLV